MELSDKLREEAKKNLCELIDKHWPKISSRYAEALEEHRIKSSTADKKMVYTVPLNVRLLDTSGETETDSNIKFGVSTSGKAKQDHDSGQTQFDLHSPASGGGDPEDD